MTTDRPRRLAAATFALAAITGLSGCGTGFDAATGAQYQPAVGANQREGDVRLYNALLVQNSDGTFSLSVGIVNMTDEEQTLVGASFTPMAGADGVAVDAEPAAEVTIGPQDLFALGTEGELAGLEIDGVSEGFYVNIVLTFDGAGDAKVSAPIVKRTADYANIAEEAPAAADESADSDEQDGTATDEATTEEETQ